MAKRKSWLTEVNRIAKAQGITLAEARSVYRTKKGLPTGEPQIHGLSNPLDLLKQAQTLLHAASGDVDKAKRALDILSELS